MEDAVWEDTEQVSFAEEPMDKISSWRQAFPRCLYLSLVLRPLNIPVVRSLPRPLYPNSAGQIPRLRLLEMLSNFLGNCNMQPRFQTTAFHLIFLLGIEFSHVNPEASPERLIMLFLQPSSLRDYDSVDGGTAWESAFLLGSHGYDGTAD